MFGDSGVVLQWSGEWTVDGGWRRWKKRSGWRKSGFRRVWGCGVRKEGGGRLRRSRVGVEAGGSVAEKGRRGKGFSGVGHEE